MPSNRMLRIINIYVKTCVYFGVTEMKSSTELTLRINGNTIVLTGPSGEITLDVTLSMAEIRIISALFEKKGFVIEKEELITIGWSGRPVSASALTVAISNIRNALNKANVEIKNIPRLGYMVSCDEFPNALNATEGNSQQTGAAEAHAISDQQTIINKRMLSISSGVRKLTEVSTAMSLLFFITAAFIISTALVYLYESSPIECLPNQDIIVCTSGEPDFNSFSMPIEFDIESFIHHSLGAK